MASPEIHQLFHHPIADHSFSADKQTLAVARESSVELYGRSGNTFKLKDELKGHDKTVTSVDIALSTGRIVTCSQGAYLAFQSSRTGMTSCSVLTEDAQIAMLWSGNLHLRAINQLSYFSALTVLLPSFGGPPLRRNSPSALAPGSSPSAISKKRMIGGCPNISRSLYVALLPQSRGTLTLYSWLPDLQMLTPGCSPVSLRE
jgi:hypothetical protein